MAMIADNLANIQERIAAAAARVGRSPEDVRIVAAAKGQGTRKIAEAVAAGIRIIGHNYLQEAEREKPETGAVAVEFHMIGHLQRNKAGKAVNLFDLVQTVDDARLAEDLDRRAAAEGRIIGVMIQVNLSREPQKSGIDESEVEKLAEAIRNHQWLTLRGLMTMPPFFDEPERARPYFARLRELRDRLIASGKLTAEMCELSMGMTGDFEVAVEEGATLVRIGTALFGPRV
jgi:pyridoxal phosphate enzyme (YggS family)